MKKIFILTGEPSGDKLASEVVKELKKTKDDIQYLSVGHFSFLYSFLFAPLASTKISFVEFLPIIIDPIKLCIILYTLIFFNIFWV